jgi:MFS family permease
MLSRRKYVQTSAPWRVLLPVGIGTSLSLLGDASLYAVLPTHAVEAGVSVASVGILLSANRFIRMFSNGPAGMAYDRWRRRRLFVAALFLGASSTAFYAFTSGFFPLLVGRLLWGLSWSGIWVGGNTIVFDIAHDESRGRWVGAYQIFFYLGVAGGSLLGGALTDCIGLHQVMALWTTLTFLGAFVALLFVPETRALRDRRRDAQAVRGSAKSASGMSRAAHARRDVRTDFAVATALYSVHRLVVAGVFSATFGLFLLTQLGDRIQIAGLSVGVATLTGLGLGLATLISAVSAPAAGGLSDRVGRRRLVAAGGLVPGIAGFVLLAVAVPFTAVISVPLVAITSGSNQGLATALIGDLGTVGWQSRQLGVMFTAGDLASAVGPVLAYALVPVIGITRIYLLAAGLLLCVFGVIVWLDNRCSAQRASSFREP